MIMYLLDKKQRIIKAVDKVIIEATMIEEINTANQLTFSVMTNSRIDTAIQYVCIPAPRGDAFLMFKLISETVKNDRVEYNAIESAYDELKAYSYVKDMRPSGKTAGQMLEQVIQGTRWSLGYIADTNQSSSSFYYVTVLEAIQKIVELFNVELTFDVNIDKKTNIISSRRINLYTQQGRRTGKRFEYGSNLLEVTREQSSENLITALVGRGKGEEVSQGEDGSPDGYGRRITFADVEWKKANGNPADKPRGQEYVEDKDATALYGFSDGSPRIGLTTFEDITDPKELLKATWASLQIAKRPQVSFKASVIDVGDLALGDTVAIIRHDLGIEYFTRVYKVEHDLLNEANDTIELGDDFSQKSLTSYIADVTKIAENVKDTAEYAVSAANGKNKNYYSKTKPQYANEGDNLFLDLGNGETELYAWHNGNWELVVSTADTTAVKRQVDQVIKDTNAHFKEIDDKYVPNETYQTEKQALVTAVEKASETAQVAKATADTASANATKANNSASEARTKVDDVAKTVTKNGKAIGEIKSDVSGVKATYATLDGKVTSVSARAGAVEAALSDGRGGLISVKAENNRIESLVDSKVNNSEYNTFKQQTSTTLSQKANKTDLNGYVTSTQFKQSADKIETVAADVKNVKTKAENIENTMKSTSFANSVVKASGIDMKVAGYDTTIRKLIGKDGTTGDLNTLVSAYSNETSQTKKQTTNLISALDYNTSTGSFGSGFAKKVADAYGTTESYKALNGKIDGLQIGGTNLLDDTAGVFRRICPSSGHVDGPIWTLKVEPQSTTITVSFDARASVAKFFECYFYGQNYDTVGYTIHAYTSQSNGTDKLISRDGRVQITPTTEWKRYWITWMMTKIPPAGTRNVQIGRMFVNPFTAGDWLEIRNVKLESGNKATDWCMSDNDVNKRIQDQADALTAYQAEVKRTYALSSSVYTKTETQTRENAIKSSTISDLKATDDWKKLIKINQNSSWIQDATGFQQQAWKYNLDSSSQLIGKKSFEDGNVGEWYCSDLKTRATLNNGSEAPNGLRNSIYPSFGTDLCYSNTEIPVKAGDTFYVEALIPNATIISGGSAINTRAILRYTQNGSERWQEGPNITVTPDNWAWLRGTVTVPDGVTGVIPYFTTRKNGYIALKTYLSYASFVKLDDYTQSNMTSIKQSSDGIGLKVAQLVGGSDISKIDMTSAAVKIDSKHILLNGDVAIDGTTFAKKIKATGITADMMLAGTIDAAKINVINIDASKITTGTLTAVEMRQSGGGTDTWINKDGIHNQMGNNNVWIKRGTLAAFDSRGQGMYMESGELTLASYAYWQNGWKDESINYGVIKCDDNITGKKGIGVIGKGGFNLRTDNSTVNAWTGNETIGSVTAGAGIIGTDDGKLILGSLKPVFIEGGQSFTDNAGLGHVPFIQVGGEMSQAGASLDRNGSSIVISAWDIKLNAWGKTNRNITMNRLTYNGEHTINLNDGALDLWWGPKMHAPSFVNTSALSKKMNIKKLDVQTAVNAIKNTDIYDYQFKEFGDTGKHYASLIIDDVNDKPQYRAAGAFIDGLGRDDGTQLGYLTVVVQNLLKEIDTLKERIDK